MNARIVGLSALWLFDAPNPASAQAYTLTELTRGGGDAINDAGQVVGASGGFAAIWNDGSPSLLGSTGAFSSTATDVNNSGAAVGYLNGEALGLVASIFKGSTTTLLPGGQTATAINNDGTAAGLVAGQDDLIAAV